MDLLERASKNEKAGSKPKKEPKKAEWDVPEVKTNPKKKEEPKPVIVKKKEPEIEEEYPMTVVEAPKHEHQIIGKFSKKDIDDHLAMYNYVKKAIVEKSDFAMIKNKPAIKKSGVRKFINAFGLSIEFIEKNVYELTVNGVKDLHAEVRVRAITPKGQSVEGIGIKSMSGIFGDKSLHNLIATAWTKAVNRAVLDLVAFGEVSAEEMEKVDW